MRLYFLFKGCTLGLEEDEKILVGYDPGYSLSEGNKCYFFKMNEDFVTEDENCLDWLDDEAEPVHFACKKEGKCSKLEN